MAVESNSQSRLPMLSELNAIDAEVTRSGSYGVQMSPSGGTERVLQLETILSSDAFARLGNFVCGYNAESQRVRLIVSGCLPINQHIVMNTNCLRSLSRAALLAIWIPHTRCARGSTLMCGCVAMGLVLRCGPLGVSLQ
jgi:hypothetical protein